MLGNVLRRTTLVIKQADYEHAELWHGLLLSWLVGVKAYGRTDLTYPTFVVLVLGLMLGCVEVRK